VSVDTLAAAFHDTIASTTATAAARVCHERDIAVVALGGGTFQNARLLSTLRRTLEEEGLRVLVPRALPPNDGAISYGQAAVAAARITRGLS
jgi:hydrogenase maturation protein HypF